MKVDVTSSVIEKGIDTAKTFLDKLVVPAVEETGLLIKDQISRFRFNNQVKTLAKAKEKCEKYGIDAKTISFKILCPLLEGASFEEEDEMIEVWSSLLSNLADTEQNIENHIFPYLLSQISLQEWEALATTYHSYLNHKSMFDQEQEIAEQVKELEYELDKTGKELYKQKNRGEITGKQYWESTNEIRKKIDNKKNLRSRLWSARNNEPELEYAHVPELYQYSNLYRLGIISKKPNYVTYVRQPKDGLNGEIETRQSSYNDDVYEYQNLKVDLRI